MKNSEGIRAERPGDLRDIDTKRLDGKLLQSWSDKLSTLALDATSDG